MQLFQPVVLGRLQLVRFHALLDQRDEGLKQRAVEPATVKVAGRRIGRGHDHDVAREQMLEQTPQDHGIGDIGHLQLVEAEQRRAGRDLLCRAADRVRGGLAGTLDRLMRLGHEFLEVDPALRREVDGIEEKVEQHGLAAADAAVKIEALRAHAPLASEGVEQIAEPRLGVVRQPVGEELQLLGGKLLRGVGGKLALEHHGAVALKRTVIHCSSFIP